MEPGTTNYRVTLNVRFPMTAAQAQDLCAHGATITVTCWPDDVGDPRKLFKIHALPVFSSGTSHFHVWHPKNAGYTAESDGLYLGTTFTAPRSALNEDDTFFNNRDEIRFLAWLNKGYALTNVLSNTVTGYF